MKRIATILLMACMFMLSLSSFSQSVLKEMGHIHNSVVGINSEPVIYNAVNLNTYELLTTNLQVSTKDNLQKVVWAPLKMMSAYDLGFIQETRINIAQKNGISTFGIGVGYDSSSPYSKRADSLFYTLACLDSQRDKDSTESDLEYAFYVENYNYTIDSAYAEFYRKLLEGSHKITAGYNVSFFDLLGGKKFDPDQDSIIEDFHVLESHNLSLGFTKVFSLKTAISFTGHYSYKVASSDSQKGYVPYYGCSFSGVTRITTLNKHYEKSKDYLQSLFIPAILFGVSVEWQHASRNVEFTADKIADRLAITPFLDFKINPKNQFRIGVPIMRYSASVNEVVLGPFAQWTLSIANTGPD